MPPAARRKTSVTLDAAALDAAHDLGINVSAIADAALRKAVTEARRARWLDENADAFARQAEWHDRNGHPLADILATPGKAAWNV
ncbi:MAG: type II toxin-antitoxin system CcdA family antitoxin [Amaricoccus sp.]|nr:type II toxin-antitoxin system CcdA family antitoxin [Amaricoccus sp.]MBP7241746.1 type II toxin-antitoxin system CcdA family antitoxin [Amaricoccus sp.]